LRDLGEDAARGRVYLPEDELERFGCTLARRASEGSVSSFSTPCLRVGLTPQFRALMRFQVDRARDYYRRAEPLERVLTNDGRAIFRVMTGIYRAVLDEIEHRGFDVFTRRV